MNKIKNHLTKAMNSAESIQKITDDAFDRCALDEVLLDQITEQIDQIKVQLCLVSMELGRVETWVNDRPLN